jgi:hypothetical protein
MIDGLVEDFTKRFYKTQTSKAPKSVTWGEILKKYESL